MLAGYAESSSATVVLLTPLQYYLRSTRYCLPKLFEALGKGNDADRMKGALYVLWNKGISKSSNCYESFEGH